MVFDDEDTQFAGNGAIVNPKRKAPHRVALQVVFDHWSEAGRLLDLGNCRIKRAQEAVPETWGPRLVICSSFDDLGLGFRMVGQSHPIARRAACMTSS